MTIGGSIALIVIGAILAFAVDFHLAGINIDVIGFILMIGGVIGLVLSLTYFRRTVGPVEGERVVERRRDIY
ncbi:MAG TPA: hypothetical protein VM324_11305 [Egibacteraceae bacterium]|jgi:uncharacterized ion transporter superfamily protein YfcC|nr:hypothetical protein [Egibacteraceae bacterium]